MFHYHREKKNLICLLFYFRLIAIGLERYLNPKYQEAKCKKSQYRLLLEALSLTVENVLVAKTLSQATNRVKNIRCRSKDAPNHPVLVSIHVIFEISQLLLVK